MEAVTQGHKERRTNIYSVLCSSKGRQWAGFDPGDGFEYSSLVEDRENGVETLVDWRVTRNERAEWMKWFPYVTMTSSVTRSLSRIYGGKEGLYCDECWTDPPAAPTTAAAESGTSLIDYWSRWDVIDINHCILVVTSLINIVLSNNQGLLGVIY